MSEQSDKEFTSDKDRQTLEIAQKAFDAFCAAVETGDSDDLIALVAEDIRFFVPLPFEEWRGEQRGRARVRELVEFERETMRFRITVEQTGIASMNNLAAIEYRVAGSLQGGAYKNHLAIFFEVENGLIKSWREYTGDVDPQAVAALSGK